MELKERFERYTFPNICLSFEYQIELLDHSKKMFELNRSTVYDDTSIDVFMKVIVIWNKLLVLWHFIPTDCE